MHFFAVGAKGYGDEEAEELDLRMAWTICSAVLFCSARASVWPRLKVATAVKWSSLLQVADELAKSKHLSVDNPNRAAAYAEHAVSALCNETGSYWLAREDVIKIVQNAKFEQKWFLRKHGVELWPIFDTWRASVLVHNGKDMDHHLWALFERELLAAARPLVLPDQH